ncbi:unnamed protein product [Euphydryas editha]|uniref:FP protein C-terminal domain-containing protein n=1 Tax=Euphydryas editha TaxID=104508 RepID=A0AAU9TTW4_EUPED|nr:unnamed protein product [Euphydryas editha]CAH2105751.1 unnamed protein product [Euphydryas editha]
MNVHRSPNKTNSQPDLSNYSDDDYRNVSARKRKIPDCCCNHQDMMEEFYNKMMTSFNAALDAKNNNIKCVLDGIREDLNSFKKQMNDVTSTIQKLTNDQVTIQKDIRDLSSTVGVVTQRVDLISSEVNELRSLTCDLSEQLKVKDQLGRINNVEISGIPLSKNENLMNIIHNIATKISFNLLPTDIDFIHRVRRFNTSINSKPPECHDAGRDSSPIPNIIVRFAQRRRKNEFLAAVRARRGMTTADAGLNGPAIPIFLNDHLAPHNKLLYKQVRLLARQKEYKYVWISDCKILLRKNDTSKVHLISCEADLIKIK